MNNNPSRLLGIDFGSKRIGIALSDESGSIAMPYSVIKNSESLVGDIVQICKEKNVGVVVVGESKNFEGKDNKIMEQITVFVEALKQTGIHVVFQPEFLTSFEAERMQYELYGKKEMLDASAATIILQSYIDSKK